MPTYDSADPIDMNEVEQMEQWAANCEARDEHESARLLRLAAKRLRALAECAS